MEITSLSSPVAFYRSGKAARLGVMRLYLLLSDKERVASVHVPVKLLTDKERTRYQKVDLLLQQNQNPYNVERLKEDGKNLGGAIEKVIDYSAKKERDEKEHASLQKKWSERVTSENDVELDIPSFFTSDEKHRMLNPDPEKVKCSFCGDWISRVNATFGKGKPRVSRQIVNIRPDDLPPTFDEKVFIQNKKLVACPDCCLRITPITNREGRIVSQGVVFPESEG